jgi:class 3 adenylate cyclase
VSDDRFVAFADILGFRSMVSTLSHEQLGNIYQRTFMVVAQVASAHGRWLTTERGGETIVVADESQAKITMRVMSDSVVLWSDSDRHIDFVDLVIAVRHLLVLGVFAGLPMRGGVAWGELTHFEAGGAGTRLFATDTVFGRGLVDAYELEARQAWCGAIVAD